MRIAYEKQFGILTEYSDYFLRNVYNLHPDGVCATFYILTPKTLSAILPNPIGVCAADCFESGVGCPELSCFGVYPMAVWFAHLSTV